jgi:acetoin utilization deacetylase AcuC-like enzyme
MATGLVTGEEYLLHDNGPLHPERPQRLRAIWQALTQTGVMGRVTRLEPRSAEVADIELVHEPRHVALIRGLAERGGGSIDPDTHVSEESYRIALLSAGGALAAVDAVLDGTVANAFVATRPPGHHAGPGRAMGFCLFNNIAIAARHAQARGVERVFILDWDVHHGNGTQDTFYADGSVFFCSLHQSSWYPFSGDADETGIGAGEGATLNLPLRAGRRDADYLGLMDSVVTEAVRGFRPELILVSAGQDCHERDPLGQMRVTNEGFGAMMRRVLDLADELCEGRVAACLEGGYDLEGLAGSVVHIVGALLGDARTPAHVPAPEKPWSPGKVDPEEDCPIGW